jgi:hypothetical protein
MGFNSGFKGLTVTATPFIDSSIHICHYMVSNVEICMTIHLDAGFKTPNPQFCRMILALLGYPSTLE